MAPIHTLVNDLYTKRLQSHVQLVLHQDIVELNFGVDVVVYEFVWEI